MLSSAHLIMASWYVEEKLSFKKRGRDGI